MTTIGGVPLVSAVDAPQDYGRWLIHGPQGSGKTTLASTLAAAGKMLFIDCIGEKGTRSFRGAAYEKNIDILRPTSVTQFDDIFYELNRGGHGYKSVVIDSLTAVQKMAGRYVLGHSETAVREIGKGSAPADFKSWGQSLDIMTDTATFWYGLADGNRSEPMHVVMTSQTKIVESEDGTTMVRRPDVQAGAQSFVMATPDYVLYCDVEENLDYDSEADDQPPSRHIVRFGSHPGYRTKGRVPVNLRGKIPSIIGRKSAPDLMQLSRILGIGGIPARARKATASTNTNNTNTKEN